MTTIGTPIKDRDGKTIGVLAAHMDLTEMSVIMAQGRELSDSEETYLVNKFNFFVTENRFVPDFPLKKALHTKGVNDCLRGKSGVGMYDDYRGIPVIGAYHWMAGWGLCILTEVDQTEAFAPIVALGKWSLGSVLELLYSRPYWASFFPAPSQDQCAVWLRAPKKSGGVIWITGSRWKEETRSVTSLGHLIK